MVLVDGGNRLPLDESKQLANCAGPGTREREGLTPDRISRDASKYSLCILDFT